MVLIYRSTTNAWHLTIFQLYESHPCVCRRFCVQIRRLLNRILQEAAQKRLTVPTETSGRMSVECTCVPFRAVDGKIITKNLFPDVSRTKFETICSTSTLNSHVHTILYTFSPSSFSTLIRRRGVCCVLRRRVFRSKPAQSNGFRPDGH